MCEVHKPEKTEKVYPVWLCKLCKKDTALSPLQGRCQFCNYPELEERQVTASEYCELVGHDGGEVRLPGTSQFVRKEWDALVEDGIAIGGHEVEVYSHEYLYHCARCGYQRRQRR